MHVLEEWLGYENLGFYEPIPEDPDVFIPKEYFIMKGRLETRLEEVVKARDILYFSGDQSSPMFKRWIEPSLNVLIYRGENQTRQNMTYNFWVNASLDLNSILIRTK
jgi:hypothetical protein